MSASSIRTPKMAPVDPVMPMMRRRITILALQSWDIEAFIAPISQRLSTIDVVALATIAGPADSFTGWVSS